MRSRLMVFVLSLVGMAALLAVGCSPSASPVAPSASGAAPAAASPAPTAALVAPTGQAAAADSSGLHLTIQANGSEARYRAHEVLAQLKVPSEAVGHAPSVSGSIVLDDNGQVVPDQSQVTVDLRDLTSDQRLRDMTVQRAVLQTSQFPSAQFTPQSVQGIPWPAPATGDFNFQMAGNLTVHGVTQPVTWTGTGHINGNQLIANASTQTKITDFGMALPKVASVLSLEDDITLEMDVNATMA